MGMDRCKCGEFVDVDEFPEAYLITAATIALPKAKQDHECVCSSCQEKMIQNMTEEDWEARQP
jgi:hypothetical protein